MALYRLKTIRLINFHNLVDHTIPVLGHLFLVGDNASGKTTVLDAVQWVLSGGQDLEFNAAARVTGSREEGRTLHGAVQRRDSERGVINTARAITYAALELEDEEGGPALSIGMGAELAHPEAQISTWGFVKDGPLSEVPLLVPVGVSGVPQLRPTTKEELRDALGKDRVYFQVGRYRDVLADKLTAGDHYFARLTDFWRISKAYKQIAAQTQDHSQLLRKMLPKPDEEAFLKVSRGMEALAQIEDSLGGLREQLDYLRGLRAHQQGVDRAREEVARYSFLKALKERDWLSEELGRQDGGLVAIRAEQDLLAELVGKARAAVAAREAELQDLRRKDREGLLEKRIELERDCRTAEAEAAAQEKAVKAANMEIARAAKALAEARRVFVEALSQWALRCSALGPPLREESKRTFLRILEEATGGASPELAWGQADLGLLHAEVLDAQTERLSSVRRLAQKHSQEETALVAARTALTELERAVEEHPDLPGYAACLRRLSEKQLGFKPLYALLEKSSAADEGDFRDLEALLGERVLGAIVPEPVDAAEVARVVLAEFPGIPVVRLDLPAGDFGDHWLGRLVAGEGFPKEAAAYLRKVCGTPDEPSAMLQGGGVAEDRGARLKLARRPFPLLGLSERRAARRRRIEEARESVSRLERLLSESAAAIAAEEGERERQRRFLTELSAAREGKLKDLAEVCRAQARAEDRLRERYQLAKDEAVRRGERARRLSERFEALKQRLAAEGLQNLDELLTQREEALRSAQKGLEDGLRKEAGARQREESLQGERSRTESSLAQAQSRVADCAAALAPLIEEKYRADLERYVLDVRQGRQFKDRIDNIEERRREAERGGFGAEAGVQAGIADIRYSGRFGFIYDRAANLVLDRRGEPLEGLARDLEAKVGENETLLGAENKKLFEEVILGDLARKLQAQVAQLGDTVQGVNRLLGQRVFGTSTRYRILVHPLAEHAPFVEAVKKLSGFSPESQEEFRALLEPRLKETRREGEDIPVNFDYRHWFEFQLRMYSSTEAGVDLVPRVARLGSGGEQAVPKYLVVLAMAKLLVETSKCKIPALLFDEAFYGIDRGRCEELISLAGDLGLQLVVSTPDQAGDREAYRKATTVFLAKDANSDVHATVARFWTDAPLELPAP